MARSALASRFGNTRAEKAWRPEVTDKGIEATNPHLGLTARFDAKGLHLKTAAGELHMTFAGIGRNEKFTKPDAAKADAEGATVRYHHGASLTQWFMNSPLGLEQGFTLKRRPVGGRVALGPRSCG